MTTQQIISSLSFACIVCAFAIACFVALKIEDNKTIAYNELEIKELRKRLRESQEAHHIDLLRWNEDLKQNLASNKKMKWAISELSNDCREKLDNVLARRPAS